ncbi:MAG TPA: hypothetical protein PLL10_10725, partial [Elusimicrobiales bacterium]|nr:hypothetical protein [Elusimicrobiales bacterium]
MKKIILCALLLAGTGAFAEDSTAVLQKDALLGAMQDEMSRTLDKLRLGDLKKPYFANYSVLDDTMSIVTASFGSVLWENMRNQYRRARVEVYVGDYAFDNSGFNYQRPEAEIIPLEAGYDGLRFSLWLMSDNGYKKALESYSRKEAFSRIKNMTEQEPSRSQAQSVKIYAPQEQLLPGDEQLREL